MVKTIGAVNCGPSRTTTLDIYLNPDDCFDLCFNDVECVLAECRNYYCYIYKYTPGAKPLQIINTYTEIYVAFKVAVPDNLCPATFDDVALAYTTKNGDVLPWKSTDNGWAFAACEEGWKRFDRPTISVCIKFVSMPEGTTKENAITNCAGEVPNMNSTLIGMQSTEEIQWVHDELISSFGSHWKNIWLDGEREGNEKTNFKYSDGMTIGNDVLQQYIKYLSVTGEEDKAEPCLTLLSDSNLIIINDVSCDTFWTAVGAMCGYNLFRDLKKVEQLTRCPKETP